MYHLGKRNSVGPCFGKILISWRFTTPCFVLILQKLIATLSMNASVKFNFMWLVNTQLNKLPIQNKAFENLVMSGYEHKKIIFGDKVYLFE